MIVTLEQAVEILRRGDLLVVPTDTVYGLACDSANEEAVRKIREIKGRPDGKPLIALIDGLEMLSGITTEMGGGMKERQMTLARAFWPGALTMVLPAKQGLSEVITSGGDTVGVRWPNHPLLLKLIEILGRPLIATSVNKSGQPALNDIISIEREFPALPILDSQGGGRVEMDMSTMGQASTVVDITGAQMKLLREGVVSRVEIEKYLNEEII